MNTKIKTIKKVVFFVIISFLFSPSSLLASELDTPMNKYDSMYEYNALENKISFTTMTSVNNPDNLKEKILESNVVVDYTIKKLKDITEKQTNSIKKSEEAIMAIESNGALKSFLIGNKLGILKYQIVQMEDENYILSNLSLETTDSLMRNQINDQLQVLEQQQTRVENFILKQQNRFSLFGWFINSL